MAKRRTVKKKKTAAKKWKTLTSAAVQRLAKAYAKSRGKKKWPSLMKKYGMKQAQRIVSASRKHTKKSSTKKGQPRKTARKAYKKKGSRKMQRSVPQHMKQVSGRRTPPFVFPDRKAFPIGTLAYAKKAIDRLSWPNEQKNARAVMQAVRKRYPTYNWPSYWNDLKKRAKLSRKLKSWSQYTR